MRLSLTNNIQKLNGSNSASNANLNNFHLTPLEIQILINGSNKLGGPYYGTQILPIKNPNLPLPQKNQNDYYDQTLTNIFNTQSIVYKSYIIPPSTTPNVINCQINDLMCASSVTVNINTVASLNPYTSIANVIQPTFTFNNTNGTLTINVENNYINYYILFTINIYLPKNIVLCYSGSYYPN